MPARECSFTVEHSGEPYTPQGTIDKRPKINPPIQYQKMFVDDISFINEPKCPKRYRVVKAPTNVL